MTLAAIERPPSPAAAILQLARLQTGMSQRELGRRAGVPASMISAYERDKRQPTVNTLLRLLKAAGLELRMHLEPYRAADDPSRGRYGDNSGEEISGWERQLELWRHASSHSGELVRIAELDDVIRSKQAAGRPKDLQVLPALLRHQTKRSRH